MSRLGDYIETYTGKTFYPLDPRPEEIDIVDIAHHLSQICRFNGASKFFFSVAQHSINVYKYVKAQGGSIEQQFDALMHDASEAYLCDLPKPIKRFMSDYKVYEDIVQEVIYQKYGLNSNYFETTKKADTDMLSYEAKILMPCKTWNHDPISISEIKIEERLISDVKEEFLKIFFELKGKL